MVLLSVDFVLLQLCMDLHLGLEVKAFDEGVDVVVVALDVIRNFILLEKQLEHSLLSPNRHATLYLAQEPSESGKKYGVRANCVYR